MVEAESSFFLYYQLSNVAKPTSAPQSNISFLSSLCEVWKLQYVLPASSRKLLCIVLFKRLQKCCQRDTVNCSFCVYVFLFFYIFFFKKRNKTFWSWKNWFLLALSVLFTFFLADIGFSSLLFTLQAYSILNRPFWQFWTCSIRFQMHWFMGICKVSTTLKEKKKKVYYPASRIVLHQDNLKLLLLHLYDFSEPARTFS